MDSDSEDSASHVDRRLGVWAPVASSVELVIGDTTAQLERHEDGWWLPVEAPPAGEFDYGFRVDG